MPPRLLALAAIGVLAVVAGSTTGTATAPARLDVPRELRVMSYFPADAGWTKMWTDWQPGVIAADLRRIAALRANTVRVVVQPNLFGYPQPSPTYVARLRRFVALAEQAGLHVQLTLFDWWYDWADLAGSRTWAHELLAPYAGDARIAFVELRNELVVKPHTVAWARAMIPFVRSVLGGSTPVTVSVTGTDPVPRLAALKRGLGSARPDFFDIHYFGGGGELAASVFGRAKAVVAPVPLWVGETGYPTTTILSGYGGVPRTQQAQEAAQAHFLASVGWAAHANGLPAAGIWTHSDLLPSAVPDREVARSDPELHYGVVRVDGSVKPAARTVRAFFAGRTPLGFNNGFEDAVEADDGAPVPARWSLSGPGVVDRTVARTGGASARLMAATTGSLSIAPPNGGIRAAQRVSVSAWARGAGTARVVIEWFDPRNRRLRRNASPLSQQAASWSRLAIAARAPAGTAYLRIALVVQRSTGAVWFDDVSFRRP